VGAAASNQKERLFVDASIIDGYHATEFRLLGIETNTTHYYTITYIGGKLVADATFLAFMDARYASIAGGTGTAKFGKLDTAVAARSGLQAASAVVSIYTMDGSGLMSDTGDNETWWNISSQGGISGDFVQGKLDATSGKMLFDWEDCTLS
jgi:hypothetical protein